MNRKQRRRNDSETRKLARDASPAEILPGTHGPVQSAVVETMKGTVQVLLEHYGSNYDITLFVAERLPADGSDRMPRFNYISTGERADMIAVLSAFVEKYKEEGPKLDKINDDPPTEMKQ